MATYYVRSSGGDDGNDGLSFGAGWATLQFAFDNIRAGDTLIVCGDFTISATVDLDMNAGANASATAADPIYVRAADASGNLYAGTARGVITTDATLPNGLFDFAAAFDYSRWYDFEFNGGGVGKADYGWRNNVDLSDYHVATNCRWTNAASHGCFVRSYTEWRFIGCRFDHNGGSGYLPVAANRGYVVAIGCVFDHNASTGVGFYGRSEFYHCLAYRNGGEGFAGLSSTSTVSYRNCTAYGNGLDGFESHATSQIVDFANCSAVSNGGYGFNFNGMDLDQLHFMRNNHTHGNTINPTDVNGNVLPGIGNITGDPLFVSTTDESEDFTPGAGSPLIGAGYSGLQAGGTSYMDIGAVQRQMAASTGGGGSLINGGLIRGVR